MKAIHHNLFLRGLVVGLLFIGVLLPACAAAQSTSTSQQVSAKDFFKGKRIKLVVPNTPGSTTDTVARIMASVVPAHLGADMYIFNDTAAGGLVAENNFYSTATPDGLTLMADVTGGFCPPWQMGMAGVQYDITKFEYLGATKRGPLALAVDAKSPYTSINELRKSTKEIKISIAAPGSLVGLAAIASLEILGVKGFIISGFSGTAGRWLAVQKGETDVTILTPEWALTEKTPKILCLLSSQKYAPLPNLPSIADFIPLTDYHKTLLNALVPDITCFIAPPGTPKDRVEFLRKVVASVFADKEFQEKVTKIMPPWQGSYTGEELNALTLALAKTRDADRATYQKLIKQLIK
jgi:tripartite-type tricarboxylate transporter receptor subunit TctC